MCDEKPPCYNITTLHTFKTEYNADSVEWCPHEPHQNVFVCANYQLNKDTRERFGRILLFSVTRFNLKLLQTIETAGVLDQKWCHYQVKDPILAVANAENTLEIYKLNSDLQLELVTSLRDNSEALLLSLDWSKNPSNEPELVCSDSLGRIHRFTLQKELVKQEIWKGHEFEAWITAFYYWDPNIFFSGGDDCIFLKFDKRVGAPVARNRSHEAGVTAMHSNSNKEFVLATGSYDTLVRLWDIRYLKNCTDSVKMPGTLWRLKWDPFGQTYLLAACMLGGLHIVKAEEKLEVVDSYYEHENIVYGADWSSIPKDTNGKVLLGSCSFYDNLLCISEGLFNGIW